jgi:hypothetical protein
MVNTLIPNALMNPTDPLATGITEMVCNELKTERVELLRWVKGAVASRLMA